MGDGQDCSMQARGRESGRRRRRPHRHHGEHISFIFFSISIVVKIAVSPAPTPHLPSTPPPPLPASPLCRNESLHGPVMKFSSLFQLVRGYFKHINRVPKADENSRKTAKNVFWSFAVCCENSKDYKLMIR